MAPKSKAGQSESISLEGKCYRYSHTNPRDWSFNYSPVTMELHKVSAVSMQKVHSSTECQWQPNRKQPVLVFFFLQAMYVILLLIILDSLLWEFLWWNSSPEGDILFSSVSHCLCVFHGGFPDTPGSLLQASRCAFSLSNKFLLLTKSVFLFLMNRL